MHILALIALVLAVLAGLGYTFLVAPIIRMPGRSFKGALPMLTEEQGALSARLRAHIVKIAGDIGARSLTSAPDALEQSAVYLETTFRSFGYEPTAQRFQVGSDGTRKYLQKYVPDYNVEALMGKETRNVIAELPGDGTTDDVIVIGAHYDTPIDLPGANDNGSGVGAMLEIARALKAARLARKVRFVAFTNEEPPFFRTTDMGSAHYAQLCHERGDRIVAMLSLETIGCYLNERGSQKYPKPFNLVYPTTGNFLSFIGNASSRALVRQCIKTFRQSARFPSEGTAAPDKIPGVDFSDHLWFWKFGYPAIMVTDTAFCRYEHYHTHEDTPDKVDYDSLARVVSGLTAVVAQLANAK